MLTPQNHPAFPDYPFEPKTLDLDGNALSYLDEGDPSAHPVVMVHGNPTWSFYYRKLVLALRDRCRCVVPDHIGMGLSDKPDDTRYDYTLERRVADLDRLIVHTGIDQPITLIVHDWGGMIGSTWAVRNPERIRRIVALNTGAFHLPKTKKMPWQLKLCRLPVVGAILVRGFNGFTRDSLTSCVTRRPMPKDVKRALLYPHRSWANRIAVHRFVQDIPLQPGDRCYDTVTDTQDKLETLRDKPMLIAWGLKDFVFDHHFLDEWTRRFPDAAVHRFEDCGHYILEDAGDEVAQLVSDFIS
ncbi:MAG: alpha/beta fold hydrolase [Planctomycetota bacterium]|jgi:haloalkane dehalogenase